MSELERARALFLAALEAQNAGRLAAAERLYREALQLAPGRPSLLNNLAQVLREQSRCTEALEVCAALVVAAPDEAQSWITRAGVWVALGDHLAAAGDLLRALQLGPDHPPLRLSLGTALLEAGHTGQAIHSLRRAAAGLPDDPDAACQLAHALLRAFQPLEALTLCEGVLTRNPQHADARLNRANALLQLARYDEALSDYARVQQLAPHSPRAWWNESLCRLLLGDFERGWKLYAHGWANGQRGEQRPRFAAPDWDGQPVDGDLLVWAEQGIGDQVLFGTMLKELQPCAREVIVAVEPRLLPLFERSLPGLRFMSGRAVAAQLPVAAQVAMGDLGGFLRGNAERFQEQPAGYLHADPARSQALRSRLRPTGAGLLVGVSWRSRNDHFGTLKSLEPGLLSPLLAQPGVIAVDLQYGDTTADRKILHQRHSITLQHCDDIDNFNDLDGLAALIEACDVVVSVSNTTVHLAGALGKPTLVLLPYALGRIWYWHQQGERSLWYPSCRLLRQSRAGDWAGPVAEALAEMKKLTNKIN